MTIAYFDGEFMPLDQVRVSPLDRGYLLGDGVYEVVPVYSGTLFRIDEHLDRLYRSLAAVNIRDPLTPEGWLHTLTDLIARNGDGDQSLYFQVTRGVAPRNHAYPDNVDPVVFAMTKMMPARSAPKPVFAITRPDNRWGRCDIKSIALLPNVLLREQAVAAGAGEAILSRDGFVTEGAASNVFVVNGNHVRTPPKSTRILAGITRDVAVSLAGKAGATVEEVDIPEADLHEADEIWVTSSTMEISPVVKLDGQAVGSGEPGPVWARMYEQFDRNRFAGTGAGKAATA